MFTTAASTAPRGQNRMSINHKRSFQEYQSPTEQERESSEPAESSDAESTDAEPSAGVEIDITEVPYFRDSNVRRESTKLTFLYHRTEVVRTMNKLTEFCNSTGRVAILEGSPGVGKSLTSWTWVLQGIRSSSIKSALWHSPRGGQIMSVSLHRSALLPHFDRTTTDAESIDVIRACKEQLLILDGVTQMDVAALSRALTVLVESKSRTRVLIASSIRLHLPHDWLDRHRRDVTFINMNPWTLDEYVAAASRPAFLQQCAGNLSAHEDLIRRLASAEDKASAIEEVKALITEKYRIAGGNARLMYTYTTDEAIEALQRSLQNIPDMRSLYFGLHGQRTDTFVTCACANFFERHRKPAHTEILSEYATRFLARNCTADFLESATTFAEDVNKPILDGQILVLDVLHHIIQQKFSERLSLSAHSAVTYAVRQVVYFRRLTDIPHERYAGGTWLVPELTNAGGYDAVNIYERPTLSSSPASTVTSQLCARFVQILRAGSRTAELHCMQSFLEAFNRRRQQMERPITLVEVVFLVPFKRMQEIVVSPDAVVTGSLAGLTYGDAIVGYRRANDRSV